MLMLNCEVFIHDKPIDMRKGINGLSILVHDEFGRNPTNPGLFVFWNRKLDRLKVLYWHINGFCLFYKVLEQQKFKIPMPLPKQLQVSNQELQWLLDGLDFSKLTGHKKLHFDVFS